MRVAGDPHGAVIVRPATGHQWGAWMVLGSLRFVCGMGRRRIAVCHRWWLVPRHGPRECITDGHFCKGIGGIGPVL